MSENTKAIWLWKFTYYGKAIPTGATLVLPLEDQRYTFKGVKHWQYRNREKNKRREVTYTFESHCVMCKAPFEFRVPNYFKTLVRTCPAHRRAWRARVAAPKPERKPITRDAYSHMGKAQNQVFNSYYESPSKALADVVRHAQSELTKRGLVITKGNLVRAYRQLVKRGAIDPDSDMASDVL